MKKTGLILLLLLCSIVALHAGQGMLATPPYTGPTSLVSEDFECAGIAACAQSSSTTTTVTCTLGSTLPNDSFWVIADSALGTTVTLSDGTNTYTSIKTRTSTAAWNVIQLSYVKVSSLTGSVTITATQNGAAAKMAIGCVDLRGAAAAPLDVENDQTSAGGATSLTSPTITAANTGETMLGFFTTDGSLGTGVTVTLGSNYSLVGVQPPGGYGTGAPPWLYGEIYINSGTTSNAATATLNANASAAIQEYIVAVIP